jgi:hypothetical protein
MTDQSSIFTDQSQATPAPQTSQQAPANPLENLLTQIKNERGEQKYKSVEDALNALKHSQEYIPQLNQRLQQTEAELEAARTAAARVAEVEATVAKLLNREPAPAATPAAVPEDKIAELVQATLQRTRAQETAAENQKKVVQAVMTKFGADADKVFYGKANELGFSVDQMNNLAATNPKAVLSLLGLTEPAPSQNSGVPSPKSGINTDGFQPQQTSFIGRNTKGILVGATSRDVLEESRAARQMVDELHSQGKTVHDLTDPKVYFKVFRKD